MGANRELPQVSLVKLLLSCHRSTLPQPTTTIAAGQKACFSAITYAARVLCRLGKRVLDSISPEERLMRGVPKDISKVIIHHPSQVPPEQLMEQMQTMTKSYGLKAVGRAAAATVMLPLAVGVDLVILPGPQVLTYYTMWQLYRNTNGALGSTRMTKFITQGGSSENIRVNYVVDSR
eukprot:GHRQ01010243.1.p1 GENE.GHRQ01010243.1~~GHRQ01010243.1.p1  ORF type:complete len:177 (+),score=81.83 GHRQ01010243.1:1426-1956(+)